MAKVTRPGGEGNARHRPIQYWAQSILCILVLCQGRSLKEAGFSFLSTHTHHVFHLEIWVAESGHATTARGRYVGRVHFDCSSTLVRH